MSRKKANESLSEALASIENKLSDLKRDSQNLDGDTISEIEKKVYLAKKSVNGIKVIFLYMLILLAISTGLAIAFGISNTQLENSNNQIQTSVKKVYEEKYRRDSVLDSIMNITYDTLGNPMYSWRIKNGKIVTYDGLVATRDSFDIYKDLLGMVVSDYGIKASYHTTPSKKGYTISYDISSPKIDSAMRLLTLYRNHFLSDSTIGFSIPLNSLKKDSSGKTYIQVPH